MTSDCVASGDKTLKINWKNREVLWVEYIGLKISRNKTLCLMLNGDGNAYGSSGINVQREGFLDCVLLYTVGSTLADDEFVVDAEISNRVNSGLENGVFRRFYATK